MLFAIYVHTNGPGIAPTLGYGAILAAAALAACALVILIGNRRKPDTARYDQSSGASKR